MSHLSAAFGLPEICAELIELFDVPEFERAWLQYCELYNAPPRNRRRRWARSCGGTNLQQGHARLTAYAAYKQKDAKLAARAWSEFTDGPRGLWRRARNSPSKRIEAPAVLNPVDEGAGHFHQLQRAMGTAGIVCLAYTRPFA